MAALKQVKSQQVFHVIISHPGNIEDVLSFCQSLFACFTLILLCLHGFECLEVCPVNCIRDGSLLCHKPLCPKDFVVFARIHIELEKIVMNFAGYDLLGEDVVKDRLVIMVCLYR